MCVCGCGADRGGWSSSGCGLVARWCVYVVLGWWVRSPIDCYCCHTKQCARCRPQADFFLVIFCCKAQWESYRQQVIYPLYPTIFDYIRLYPIIFHYIPPYRVNPIISHHIPPYPTISHHIKPGISQRYTPEGGWGCIPLYLDLGYRYIPRYRTCHCGRGAVAVVCTVVFEVVFSFAIRIYLV